MISQRKFKKGTAPKWLSCLWQRVWWFLKESLKMKQHEHRSAGSGAEFYNFLKRGQWKTYYNYAFSNCFLYMFHVKITKLCVFQLFVSYFLLKNCKTIRFQIVFLVFLMNKQENHTFSNSFLAFLTLSDFSNLSGFHISKSPTGSKNNENHSKTSSFFVFSINNKENNCRPYSCHIFE